MKPSYTKEQLEQAVKESRSIRHVLEKLGLATWGDNYASIHKFANLWGVSLSSLIGRGWAKGRTVAPKRNVNEYLTNSFPIDSFRLKNRLLKEGILKPICNKCELKLWLEKPIPLELHHIDGNKENNLITNLELLCPNCHAQTENYRSKNVES